MARQSRNHPSSLVHWFIERGRWLSANTKGSVKVLVQCREGNCVVRRFQEVRGWPMGVQKGSKMEVLIRSREINRLTWCYMFVNDFGGL